MISTGTSEADEMIGSGIPGGSRDLNSTEQGTDDRLFPVSTFLGALAWGLSWLVILPNTTVDEQC